MKLTYTTGINKEYEASKLAKSIPPTPYILPMAAIARGKNLPPIFGNNTTTYYKPHSLPSSGTGSVVNSRRKSFRT